ncbi:hypothetical protein B0H12DRAFT_1077305 [Mycena haematopus]|nr:hypothetical protein B0H12DRAFT_1077305 [Mycena haematopus]
MRALEDSEKAYNGSSLLAIVCGKEWRSNFETMGRRKSGQPRGRKSDFTEEKQVWLDGWRQQIQDAGADPGAVYTDATLAWIRRYGYDLPFSENVDGDPDDNVPIIDDDPDPEEKLRRQDIQKRLRAKLANYFRNRWKAKKLHSGAIKSILGTMQTMSGPGARPRRKPAIQVYSKLHYATRIKAGFDAYWSEAKATLPASARVAMAQDYVRSCWALKDWKASRKIPEGSAEEYHEAMESLNDVGISMADALSERLGCHVDLKKGSIFSDTSNQETSRTWAQFDHKGFTAMEQSITRYGRAAFSKALCRERAWPPLEPSGEGLLTIDPGFVSPATVAPVSSTPGPVVSTDVAPITVAPITTVVAPTPASTLTPPSLTPPSPAAVPGPTALDDGIDRTGWAPSLVAGHAYLAGKKWGPRWTALVAALVKHEWAYYHLEEDGNLPKMRSRPAEYADWMKQHRVMCDFEVSADFGNQLLQWWRDLGFAERWAAYDNDNGEVPRTGPTRQAGGWSGHWARLQKRGRNGPVLLLLGLAWWGQGICNAAAAGGLGAAEAALEACM